jgi:hypothetical protein
MDFTDIQSQLDDLPPTFKRPDQTYRQWVDAWTAGLYRVTLAGDGTSTQLTFANAAYGWLDVWGLLFGIPRRLNEVNPNYAKRIAFEVLAGAGPPAQIALWISIVYNVNVQVVENLPNVGYTLIFPASVNPDDIDGIINSLAYVRPAGVPITAVYQQNRGTFLETINFFDAPSVIGAYLAGGLTQLGFTINASTNNALPLLPDLYLTDPTLNPSLAVA